jgi:hypothetical protein
MTDYSKTKIYKIESHLGDKIYVGSTAKFYLSQRFQQHKSAYKQWKEGKGSNVTSYELFDEYGVENCCIVLIEECPCNNKDSKNARESHYIRELQCVNKCIPGRTDKQYYEDNKNKIKERDKQYRENNKDKIKERDKQYYEDNKDKIKQYREDNKDKILEGKKQYRENNKNKILESNKQYREDNKDKMKQYREDNKDKIKQYREDNKDKMKQYYQQKKAEKLEKLEQLKSNEVVLI